MARQYEDGDTRRRQVVEATLQTLAEAGVTGFTTRAVADRVGISEGSLFRHFESKREIVLAAMDALEEGIREGLVSTGDPWSDLEGFFRQRAAFVGNQQSVGRLIFSDELVHLAGEEGRARVAAWRTASVTFLLDRLSRLEVEGRLRPGLGVPGGSLLVQGLLLTFAMQASLGAAGPEAAVRARIDHAWSTLTLVLRP